jgi:hypothetical protein
MQCKQCSQEKPPSEYYASNKSTCRECLRSNALAYRAANIDRVREYDRNRPNHDSRRELNKDRYRRVMADPEERRRVFDRLKFWQVQNSDKRKAHILVGNAIKRGRLVKQPCERCGAADGLHAHHEDYSRPLDVTWLCVPCHAQRHREINEERRQA